MTWNEGTFERLIAAAPETLRPRLRITHSMVLSIVEQGRGRARARRGAHRAQPPTPEESHPLGSRRQDLRDPHRHRGRRAKGRRDGAPAYALTVDLPEDFALDQPLSPFLLAALELLDPESETYTWDLISMVEATLEDPSRCCAPRSAPSATARSPR